jgi:hypothetical protein
LTQVGETFVGIAASSLADGLCLDPIRAQDNLGCDEAGDPY